MAENDHKRGVNPAVAGVAGAVIGAGVGVAAATVLADSKKRRKLMDAATNVRDKVSERVSSWRDEAMDKAEQITEAKIAKPRSTGRGRAKSRR